MSDARWSIRIAALVGCCLLARVGPASTGPGGAGIDFSSDVSLSASQSATELVPAVEPSIVDMGIFYALELRDRGRSLRSLDETIASMVGYTNEALDRSGVPLTLRVTYADWYSERLEGLNVIGAYGQLGENVRVLRETLLTDFGVDIVVLIKATDDVDQLFGFASLGSESALSDPTHVPRAVVCLGAAQTSGLECFGTGGIFAHEVGHMFGAGHQRDATVGGSGGAFPFSFASECGGGTIVYIPISAAVQIYSTPTISAGGEPCGISASEGENGTDNAYTIDLTRALVADLRPTMPVAGSVFIEGQPSYAIAEGEPSRSFAVRRDGDLSLSAAVNVAVVNPARGHAELAIDPDYVAFTPGQDAVTVQIRAVDDLDVENDELLEVQLRNPLRLEVTGSPVMVTVSDNDVPLPPAPGGGGGGSADWVFLILLLLFACRSRWCAGVARAS